jgi:diadenosine tetraphosphatase ApaH/serine/threonine PP2A family protein phosphatase
MRYVLLSDIHGNLEALTAVLEALEGVAYDRMICLGDVVGYGANPDECVKIIRERTSCCLLGNHEAAVVGKLDKNYFTPYARQAAIWTHSHVSPETINWLLTLPLTQEIDDFTIVHGSLFHPDLFNYVQTIDDAEYNFKVLNTQYLFLGHSHQPIAFFNTDPLTYTLGPDIEFSPNEKAIVNVGSVGQPRDENPLAAYVIYDSEKKTVSFCRVEYDIETAAQKIIDANLPEAMAMRLKVGR